jgi:hypothetical protein
VNLREHLLLQEHQNLPERRLMVLLTSLELR